MPHEDSFFLAPTELEARPGEWYRRGGRDTSTADLHPDDGRAVRAIVHVVKGIDDVWLRRSTDA